jgi:hypothetical protein
VKQLQSAQRATGGQASQGTPVPYRPATFCARTAKSFPIPAQEPAATAVGVPAAVTAAGRATGWPQRSRRGFAHRAYSRVRVGVAAVLGYAP